MRIIPVTGFMVSRIYIIQSSWCSWVPHLHTYVDYSCYYKFKQAQRWNRPYPKCLFHNTVSSYFFYMCHVTAGQESNPIVRSSNTVLANIAVLLLYTTYASCCMHNLIHLMNSLWLETVLSRTLFPCPLPFFHALFTSRYNNFYYLFFIH